MACKMFYKNNFRFEEPENINERLGIYPLILCISILKLIWAVFSDYYLSTPAVPIIKVFE